MVRWFAMVCLGAAIVASTWRDPVAPALRRLVRPIPCQVASAPDPRVDPATIPATTTAHSCQTTCPYRSDSLGTSSFRPPSTHTAANPNRKRTRP